MSLPLNLYNLDYKPLTFIMFITQSLTDCPIFSEDEVRCIIMSSPTKSCMLDPILTHLLKESVLFPYLTAMVNTSLCEGCLPASHRDANISKWKRGMDLWRGQKDWSMRPKGLKWGLGSAVSSRGSRAESRPPNGVCYILSAHDDISCYILHHSRRKRAIWPSAYHSKLQFADEERFDLDPVQ